MDSFYSRAVPMFCRAIATVVWLVLLTWGDVDITRKALKSSMLLETQGLSQGCSCPDLRMFYTQCWGELPHLIPLHGQGIWNDLCNEEFKENNEPYSSVSGSNKEIFGRGPEVPLCASFDLEDYFNNLKKRKLCSLNIKPFFSELVLLLTSYSCMLVSIFQLA